MIGKRLSLVSDDQRLAQALQVFLKEALRYAPDFHRARLALWNVYTEQGEHQQALDVVRQVPADHPLSRQARFHAALSISASTRWRDLVSTFRRARRGSPVALR